MFMGTQGLHAAFVLVVPDPNGLVISTAYYESSSRVKQYPAHPVVMSHLQTQDRLATTLLTIHPLCSDTGTDTSVTHQSHEADPNAHIPHLDRFISGAREQERPRFSTLLILSQRQR